MSKTPETNPAQPGRSLTWIIPKDKLDDYQAACEQLGYDLQADPKKNGWFIISSPEGLPRFGQIIKLVYPNLS